MTQQSQPWESSLVGDATIAPYSALEWASYWNKRHGVGSAYPNYGIIKGTGGGVYEPLTVLATNPVSVNVEVQIGSALVNGRLYQTDAVVTLPIAANASGNARIDTIILRVDYVLQTVRAAVLQGTPAGSPVRPTLTQSATFWEIPLADVAVANGFSTIAQTNITQRRRYVNTTDVGWTPRAYPIIFSPTAAYATDLALTANGGTLLIPFPITGNMRVASLTFLVRSTNLPIVWGWDIYAQDVNDGNAAENTLRRVARSDGNQSTTTPGAPTSLTLNASGGFEILTPGLYWVALQNRSPSNNFNIGTTAATAAIAFTSAKSKVTTNPNGDTLDAVLATWTAQTALLGVFLSGAVFGQSVAYV